MKRSLSAGVDTCTRSHFKLLMGEKMNEVSSWYVDEGTICGLRPEERLGPSLKQFNLKVTYTFQKNSLCLGCPCIWRGDVIAPKASLFKYKYELDGTNYCFPWIAVVQVTPFLVSKKDSSTGVHVE